MTKKEVLKAARAVYQKAYCAKCHEADAPLCNAIDAYDAERKAKKEKRWEKASSCHGAKHEWERITVCAICGHERVPISGGAFAIDAAGGLSPEAGQSGETRAEPAHLNSGQAPVEKRQWTAKQLRDIWAKSPGTFQAVADAVNGHD